MGRRGEDITRVDCVGYSLLACEIVGQAIQDWKLLCNGKKEFYQVNFKELRRFFNSEYCDCLLTLCKSNLTGKEILQYLEDNFYKKKGKS